jgi:OHCU decarboxylase
VRLSDLNALPREAAERELGRCCASARWSAAVAARRPFANVEELCRVGDEVWWTLEGGDWLEAFARHPRIGERAAGWASDEQAGARQASAATLQRLNELNHEYERKFGHVFLISATGKSAEEILAQLEKRIANDVATELKIAALEQSKIMRLRLEKLLAPPQNPPRRG